MKMIIGPPFKLENYNRMNDNGETTKFDSDPKSPDGKIVREIFPFTDNGIVYQNLIRVNSDKEVDKLMSLAKNTKVLWANVASYGINIPVFDCVISKLSNGHSGLLIVSDKITLSSDESPEGKERRIEKLKIMLRNFKRYYDSKVNSEDYYWTDVKADQFIYGRPAGSDTDEWYLIDLDPRFSEYNKYDINKNPTMCYNQLYTDFVDTENIED